MINNNEREILAAASKVLESFTQLPVSIRVSISEKSDLIERLRDLNKAKSLYTAEIRAEITKAIEDAGITGWARNNKRRREMDSI